MHTAADRQSSMLLIGEFAILRAGGGGGSQVASGHAILVAQDRRGLDQLSSEHGEILGQTGAGGDLDDLLRSHKHRLAEHQQGVYEQVTGQSAASQQAVAVHHVETAAHGHFTIDHLRIHHVALAWLRFLRDQSLFEEGCMWGGVR